MGNTFSAPALQAIKLLANVPNRGCRKVHPSLPSAGASARMARPYAIASSLFEQHLENAPASFIGWQSCHFSLQHSQVLAPVWQRAAFPMAMEGSSGTCKACPFSRQCRTCSPACLPATNCISQAQPVTLQWLTLLRAAALVARGSGPQFCRARGGETLGVH